VESISPHQSIAYADCANLTTQVARRLRSEYDLAP
jgi:hypothetical protein